MDEDIEDREDPEEEERMFKLKRLVTDVVVEGTKVLIEKIWNRIFSKPKRLS